MVDEKGGNTEESESVGVVKRGGKNKKAWTKAENKADAKSEAPTEVEVTVKGGENGRYQITQGDRADAGAEVVVKGGENGNRGGAGAPAGENTSREVPEVKTEGQSAVEPDSGEAGGRGRKKALIISLCVFLALVLLGAGGWFYIDSLAYKLCRVEAGVAVTPSDFLKTADEDAYFAEGSQPFDVTEPGEYRIKVRSGFFTHSCTLIIEDTIAPSGRGRTVQMEMGGSCGAEEFVSDISDATAVTASFAQEPDFTVPGEQAVRVILEDRGGNQAYVEAVLFITQVVDVVTVEVGGEAPGLESFVIAGQDVSFVTDMEEIDFTRPGEYQVSVMVDGREYTSVLRVADTTPPQVEVRDVESYLLAPVNTEAFVVSVEDATEVTAAFRSEPDLTLVGAQEVELVFTDEGGNETVKQAKLTLMEDTEAPVIKGAKDLTVYIGDGVPYRKNVSVEDNCPEGVELTVDTGAVNLDAEGVYPVTYTARDLAGNQTSVTINLTVISREFNPDKVYAMADEVLADILTDGMSEMDKVTAIYDYVKGHVSYVSHSEKGDWLKAAYEGLSTGKGDCYTYAHTSRLLLDRAGIKNMIIEKIPAKTRHVWNLVDIGDGWYHFDACPRRGLTEKVLMWTDERLMEYSDSHNKSHNYDRTVYTDIN